MTKEILYNIKEMNQEDVGSALEKLSKDSSTEEVITLAGELIVDAMDKGYNEFSNGNTITDYQIIFMRKAKEITRWR